MLPGVVGAKRGQKSQQGKLPGRQRFALILFVAVFALLFIGFAIAQGIGSPSVPSGDVAIVSNVPDELGNVTEEEFEHALEQQAAQAKLKKTPQPGDKKYEELKEAALGEILNQIWLEGEAEAFGVTVTDKQVETELEKIKKESFPTPAAYKKFLKESKFTQEDVDARVRLQLLGTQLQELAKAGAPKPTSSEIDAYYAENKAEKFTTKESRDVRVVINEDKGKVEAAAKALAKDNSEAGWKAAVKKYSNEPARAKEAGLQKGITEEFLQEPLKKAIFGSATGEVVGPVKFEKNYIVLEVVKLTPAKTKTLAEAKPEIKSTLEQEKQQEYFNEFVAAYNSRWQSRTRCASGFVIKQCSNYKGTAHPENAPPACYEANPKTPATECPAPVPQTQPALPGTVTELKPKGEQFPQRPRPEKSSEAAAGEGAGAAEAAPEASGE
jgi:parvulin-like peptidyl-prolyl isomerase